MGATDEGARDAAGNLMSEGRREFLKGAMMAGGAAASFAAAGLSSVTTAQAQPGMVPGTKNHYYVPATDKTVHWGYFSKLLKPQVEVSSGDFVTIETLTHHANDDAERMVKGDPGAESVFYWDKQRKGVDRRGAGPMDADAVRPGRGRGPRGAHLHRAGRGAEGGAGRHPRGADPRRAAAAVREPAVQGQELRQQRGRVVGLPLQGAADRAQAARGDHDLRGRRERASATGRRRVYNFRWTPQTDPSGVVHKTIDYPGVPVDHRTVQGEPRECSRTSGCPSGPHFGVHGPGARRGRHGRLDPAELHRRQHRRLAHRQGRHDVLPGRR